jgi:prefoldin subunit 5
MADIRMLQEQAQLLQNAIATLNETLKTVNSRLDEQANANRKSFADQKLVIDQLSGDTRVIREKLDDTNVRVGSLAQEMDALREAVQQVNVPTATPPAATTDPSAPGAAAPAGTTAPPPGASST